MQSGKPLREGAQHRVVDLKAIAHPRRPWRPSYPPRLRQADSRREATRAGLLRRFRPAASRRRRPLHNTSVTRLGLR